MSPLSSPSPWPRWLFLSGLIATIVGCSRTEDPTQPNSEGDPPKITTQEINPGPARRDVTIKASGQLGPGTGTLVIDIQAPKGTELTEGAPLRVKGKGQHLAFPKEIKKTLQLSDLPVRLPVEVTDGAVGPAEVDLTFYYCTKGDSASCRPEHARLEVELDLTGSGDGGEAHLVHQPKI